MLLERRNDPHWLHDIDDGDGDGDSDDASFSLPHLSK